jgi:RNA polymerase sigma factor FliA
MSGEQPIQQPDPPEVLERFHQELGLAQLVARQIGSSLGAAVQFDEVLSAAREGLLGAARKFDCNRGSSFRKYANARIRGSIIDHLRKTGPLPRSLYLELGALEAAMLQSEEQAKRPRNSRSAPTKEGPERRLNDHLACLATASILGFSRDGCDTDTDTVPDELLDPEQALLEAELFEQVREAVRRLPQDYASIIQMYYFENYSMEMMAERMNFSVSWTSRLHARAIAQLTEYVQHFA